MPTVFWSWQSDRPARETRDLIRDALDFGVHELAAETLDADRPESSELAIDHDTKGLPGSPDITAAILAKIDAAVAFVADVTPIAISGPDEGRRAKHIANPNVLIELGYAKKSLGPDRILQVWNTAFTNCSPEDLPFDMRGRRGPFAFHLPAGASREDLRKVREKLASDLKSALSTIVSNPPATTKVALPWKVPTVGNPSVWFDVDARLLVNEDWQSGELTFTKGATRYVRMLPNKWDPERPTHHAALLGHTNGYSWGQTTGGQLTYTGSVRVPEEGERTQATIWFKDTGEVWAFDRFIVHDWKGFPTIMGDDLVKGWASFIGGQLKLLLENGGCLPVHVKLGVVGLSGSRWPTSHSFGAPPQALEDAMEHGFTISEVAPATWLPNLIDAWTRYRSIYSIAPATLEDMNTLVGLPIFRGNDA